MYYTYIILYYTIHWENTPILRDHAKPTAIETASAMTGLDLGMRRNSFFRQASRTEYSFHLNFIIGTYLKYNNLLEFRNI